MMALKEGSKKLTTGAENENQKQMEISKTFNLYCQLADQGIQNYI